MPSARAAACSVTPSGSRLAARGRQRLQLLQVRVDGKLAIVEGQAVDDAVAVYRQALLMLGRLRVAPVGIEGEAQPVDRPPGEQRREPDLVGGRGRLAGQHGADVVDS